MTGALCRSLEELAAAIGVLSLRGEKEIGHLLAEEKIPLTGREHRFRRYHFKSGN